MTEHDNSNEIDENLRKLALKMPKENIDIKIIAQTTGLSIDEIKKLQASS